MKTTFLVLIVFSLYTSEVQNTANFQNSVSFTIPKLLWSVKGKFQKVESQISFNPENLGQSFITGYVSISSLDTENDTRDGHLQGKDWFYSEKHPKIVILSKEIKQLNELAYEGLFDIMIKGINKEKKITFRIDDPINPHWIKAEFTLKLSDFNIGSGKGIDWVVGNEVNVKVLLFNPGGKS